MHCEHITRVRVSFDKDNLRKRPIADRRYRAVSCDKVFFIFLFTFLFDYRSRKHEFAIRFGTTRLSSLRALFKDNFCIKPLFWKVLDVEWYPFLCPPPEGGKRSSSLRFPPPPRPPPLPSFCSVKVSVSPPINFFFPFPAPMSKLEQILKSTVTVKERETIPSRQSLFAGIVRQMMC